MVGTSVKYMQLRSRSIVVYSRKYSRSSKQEASQFKFNSSKHDKAYSGKVTTHSKRRIRKAVQVLTQISNWQQVYNPITQKEFNFKLTFITLTISTQERLLSGKEAYTLLLKPFIQTMQRNQGMTSYIWKAELQQNGQIHYHITTNTFIRFDLIRKRWNYLQQKAGLLESYFEKHGHYNPNSTDIHKVYNDDNIEAYLEKYISKSQDINPVLKANLMTNDLVSSECCLGSLLSCSNVNLNDELSVNGKVWDCSQDLKSTKLFTVELLPANETNILSIDKSSTIREVTTDYFSILYFEFPSITKLLYGYQHKLYSEWKDNVSNWRHERLRKRRLKKQRLTVEQLKFDLI